MEKYTEKQMDDIKAREKEALEALKRLNLTPACQIFKEHLDTQGDVFGDRLYPYLQDVKYVRKGDKFVERGIESPYLDPKDVK